MSRSTRVFIVCIVAVAHAALLRPQSSFAQTASPQISAAVQAACASDVQSLCSGVQRGGGRIIACLKQHQAQVSDGCKQAVTNAMQQSRGGAGSATSPPLLQWPIRLLQRPVQLPQRPVPLRLRSSTTTMPVLRRTLHQVRRANRTATLLQLRQPSQASIIF